MNSENQSVALSLLVLCNSLRNYKRLIVGLPLVSALFASMLVYFVLSPSWEATAVVEIGRIAQLGGAAPTPVEPTGNVLSRMTLPAFAKGAINFAGLKPDEIKTMQHFYDTLKVSQVKNSELVEVKIKGPSEEMAGNLLRGAILNLQKMHSEMIAVTIEKYNKQDQLLIEEINKLQDEIKLLRQKLLASHNWNTFDANLAATVLRDSNSQLNLLIQNKLAIEEQLNPSRTYTSRVIENIDISDGPVSPRKSLIIGLAFFLGLLGAVVIALTHKNLTLKL